MTRLDKQNLHNMTWLGKMFISFNLNNNNNNKTNTNNKKKNPQLHSREMDQD